MNRDLSLPRPRRRERLPGALLVAAWVGACGLGSDPSEQARDESASRIFRVEVTAEGFSPRTVVIDRGSAVEWSLAPGAAPRHRISIPSLGWQGAVSSNEPLRRSFREPGSFVEVRCLDHGYSANILFATGGGESGPEPVPDQPRNISARIADFVRSVLEAESEPPPERAAIRPAPRDIPAAPDPAFEPPQTRESYPDYVEDREPWVPAYVDGDQIEALEAHAERLREIEWAAGNRPRDSFYRDQNRSQVDLVEEQIADLEGGVDSTTASLERRRRWLEREIEILQENGSAADEIRIAQYESELERIEEQLADGY